MGVAIPSSTQVETLMEGHGNGIGNKLTRIISRVDEADAAERYQVKGEDNKVPRPNTSSSESDDSLPPRKIISWEDEDPENPYNWSIAKKISIVIIGMIIVINSNIGSSLPANAIPFISKEFNVTSSTSKTLPLSMYLVGYILGPLFFGPLSETYGRKLIMTSTFILFTIFTMACALAPSFESFLIFRLITGMNASSPIALTGAIYADLYDDPVARGRAVAMFMAGTCVGPLLGPVISGFVSPGLGWRWSFWIGLMIAGVSLIPVYFLPETFGPILLARRAQSLRKSTGRDHIFARIELEKKGFKQMATVTLTRPLRMLFFEPIVSATCAYLSLIYGTFYMYFQAYPIVYQGIYKLSPGVSGLMFLPIFAGAVIATSLFIYYDTYFHKAQRLNKSWTRREEARRLPLACIGGPFLVIALFWLGWTSREDIPFYVPMLAGIPFGVGFVLLFIALLNYLTDAYEIFAASAMAAGSCCRSLAGAVLPFATAPMYRNLGVAWATSLLAFLSLGMCAIPFIFLWKGESLRAGSKFSVYLKENKAKEQAERARERAERIQVGRTAEMASEKV